MINSASKYNSANVVTMQQIRRSRLAHFFLIFLINLGAHIRMTQIGHTIIIYDEKYNGVRKALMNPNARK